MSELYPDGDVHADQQRIMNNNCRNQETQNKPTLEDKNTGTHIVESTINTTEEMNGTTAAEHSKYNEENLTENIACKNDSVLDASTTNEIETKKCNGIKRVSIEEPPIMKVEVTENGEHCGCNHPVDNEKETTECSEMKTPVIENGLHTTVKSDEGTEMKPANNADTVVRIASNDRQMLSSGGTRDVGVFPVSKQLDVKPTSMRPVAPVRVRPSVQSSASPPMSSMEEENLRERLHTSLIRQCSELVHTEARYTRDTFKRLFYSKVKKKYYECFPICIVYRFKDYSFTRFANTIAATCKYESTNFYP